VVREPLSKAIVPKVSDRDSHDITSPDSVIPFPGVPHVVLSEAELELLEKQIDHKNDEHLHSSGFDFLGFDSYEP